MEGKSLLFKMMGGVDAIPLCVSTKNVNDIVQIVKWLEPTLGGLNMEDISAPRCFEIEKRLIEEVHIPIFHDDQHGTAIVVLSALINATKVVSKDLSKIKVVISGAGAAGIAVADLLLNSGVPEVLVCDSKGAVYPGRQEGMNPFKEDIAVRGNIHGIKGSLAEALKGADALVGVSAGGIVSTDMIREMRAGAIVIAMANPVPEIYPAEAKAGGAAVVGTGRSDFPNQVNNVLAFPGILRGALDVRAKRINEEMRVAAARAIAELITDSELSADYIIPDPFDKRVAPHVASAVAKAAIRSGVAQADVDPDLVYSRTIDMTK
jgi:malate dehydrogenase (oxaloacetate-decarboxylating)